MSKAETLLKKAITFERLALYGDRRDFLQALSQEIEQVTGPGQKMKFDPSQINAPEYKEQESNIPPPPAATTPTVEVPEETISADVPAKPAQTNNSDTVGLLQNFLNRAFRDEIIAGKMGPIRQDSLWGTETSTRLKQWAQKNNVNASNLQDLINTALQSAKA